MNEESTSYEQNGTTENASGCGTSAANGEDSAATMRKRLMLLEEARDTLLAANKRLANEAWRRAESESKVYAELARLGPSDYSIRRRLATANDTVELLRNQRDEARAELQIISLGAGLTNFSTPIEDVRRMAVGVVAENELLRAEVARLQTDKERLDWLARESFPYAESVGKSLEYGIAFNWQGPLSLREAIDAARAAQEPKP